MNWIMHDFNFLTDKDQEELLRLIDTLHWEKGRQETGYLKSLVPVKDSEHLKDLVARSLCELGQEDLDCYDCYILKYPTGSFIPPHKDKGRLFGKKHWRLNALIAHDHTGGQLVIEDRQINLLPGDALVFTPDEMTHSVSEITNGIRYVWSVGTML